MNDGTRRAPLPVAHAARRAKPYNARSRAPAGRMGSAQRSLPPRSGRPAGDGPPAMGLRGAACVCVCALPLLQVLRGDPRNVKAMYRLACALEVRGSPHPLPRTHTHARTHTPIHAEKARSCWHAPVSLHARARMHARAYARARAHKVVRINTPYRRALHRRSRCTGPHATALRLEPDWRRGYHPEADVGEGRAQPRCRCRRGGPSPDVAGQDQSRCRCGMGEPKRWGTPLGTRRTGREPRQRRQPGFRSARDGHRLGCGRGR
jgi:hypothetical protein